MFSCPLYFAVTCHELVNIIAQSPLPYTLVNEVSAYLQVGRLVFEAWLIKDGFNLLPVEVGDPDSFDQTSINKLLHSLMRSIRNVNLH